MTYLNISMLFLLVLTASCCGQDISINPSKTSSTLLEGDQFRRVCLINNRPAWASIVQFRWLKDGVLVSTQNTSDAQFPLEVAAVSLSDAGRYVCEASLFSAAGTQTQTLTPSSGERLNVISGDLISAPPVQIGYNGTNFSLTCAYQDGIVSWLNGITGDFSPLTLADEGTYTCSIVFVDNGDIRTVTKEISLQVAVPVRIVSTTLPVHQELTRNQPVSLSISFTGRTSHNLTVTWYRDGTPIINSDPRICTNLSTAGTSQSTLSFRLAQRADNGIYRVEVSSVVGGNPPSRDERTFQLEVTVVPSHPAGLLVTQSSSTTARATWLLTNSTADSGAHTLKLTLTYAHNRSHADTITLPGGTTSHLLEGLAPATNYTLQATAINPDGMASSHTQFFATREGRALLNSVTVSHINTTHIAIVAEVAYTGGGAIQTFRVTYGPGLMVDLQGVEPVDPLRYRGLLEREPSDEPQVLTVSVINQHNYLSNTRQVTVLPYELSEPSSETTPTIPDHTSSPLSSLPLPLWLILVVVALVLVLVGVVILACVGGIYRCRRPKKGRLPVSALNTEALKKMENSRQENLYSPSHSSSEEFRSRSQTESLASTCGGHTPSLDKINHKRVPSDCSSNVSIAKPNIATPTTTASSSPSNLTRTGGFASQDQGLGMIMEMEPVSHSSDDSCPESDRDRLRRMKCEEEMERDKNMINADLHRAPGDGSPCDSHQSLVPAGCNLMISASNPALLSYNPKVAQSDSGLFLHTALPRIGTPSHEYMYSDCESVASTEVSCGNCSLPPHHYPGQQPHHIHHPSRHLYNHTPRHAHNSSLKSVHERTATPYNRGYDEGSMV